MPHLLVIIDWALVSQMTQVRPQQAYNAVGMETTQKPDETKGMTNMVYVHGEFERANNILSSVI